MNIFAISQFPGKDEISNTASNIAKGLRNADIKFKDVDEQFFDQCLYTHQSPHPELVIRTSGEYRLSDFLTWQVRVNINGDKVISLVLSLKNNLTLIYCILLLLFSECRQLHSFF